MHQQRTPLKQHITPPLPEPTFPVMSTSNVLNKCGVLPAPLGIPSAEFTGLEWQVVITAMRKRINPADVIPQVQEVTSQSVAEKSPLVHRVPAIGSTALGTFPGGSASRLLGHPLGVQPITPSGRAVDHKLMNNPPWIQQPALAHGFEIATS